MPHGTTIRTNGQVLTVNSSVSYWTTEALALVASASDDVESTTTTTITTDTTLWFANTATTAVVTVKQPDGSTLFSGTLQVGPGVGPRTLNPLPDGGQVAAETVRRDLALAPSGAIAETMPRAGGIINATAILSTGRMFMCGIFLPANTVITSITFVSATTAAVTPANQWFALYSSGRVLRRQTTDDTTTAWGANTAKTLNLTTPYTTTSAGLHYLGINVTAGTVPTLAATSPASHITGIVPILAGTSDTGLTATAPATAAAITADSRYPYAYVS